MHILALHETGSNNPDGIEIKENKGPDGIPVDGIAFHPYYTAKDLVAIIVFLILFSGVVFFAPEMGGYFLEHANFEPADPLKTPVHIAPVWYFTPFYAILRAIPSKLGGVLLMGGAILVLFLLPWIDRSKVKSIRYRGWGYKGALAVFAISFLALGVLGTLPAEGVYTLLARIFSFLYFAFFVYLYIYTGSEKGKPVPARLTYHG
jgi:ubiquinol-cytochrome c reductase cytochrome b subunit